MTWKSTAVVSGAGLLSMWFAASPPAPSVSTTSPATTQPAATAGTTGSDIEQEAERLQARVRRETEYREPSRNLFRFGPRLVQRPAATAAPSAAAPSTDTTPEFIPPAPPPPPPVSLSGVATDQAGDRTVRTAILSSPSGVLLVHEGDDVLGQFRVERIGEDAVDLTRLSDGSPLRLALKR
jgi:hypothetical protein